MLPSHPRLSIVIPTRNEAGHIVATLQALGELRAAGHEVIVVDGGSSDATVSLAAPLCDRVIHAERGRASQQNAGAAIASGEVLWFLHADTRVPAGAAQALLRQLGGDARGWGRFDIAFEPRSAAMGVIAFCMNLRSRLTAIATGDQGLFVHAALFRRAGGFPSLPLMEDVELSRRLKRLCRPCCLRARLVTSARRWRRHGLVSTVLLMWWLRAAYFCGVDPRRLARWYAGPGLSGGALRR